MAATGSVGLEQVIGRVAGAHGVSARDLDGGVMELDLTAGGPAFAVKGQRDTFEDVHATVTLLPQKVAFAGAGWSEEWAVPELLVGYGRLARGRRRLRWTRRRSARRRQPVHKRSSPQRPAS